MNDDLIERYLYAATKNLPVKTRKDIEDELRSLIDDMLMERCGKLFIREEDIIEVLTELGAPAELGEKYSPDGGKCLIGPPYYRKYVFLLKIVLLATAFGMSVSSIVTALMNPVTAWYLPVFSWLSMTLLGLAYAFCIVTVLFAAFQRWGIALLPQEDRIVNLPPVPLKQEIISKWEPMTGIAFSVVFFLVFLIAPQIFCAVIDGVFVPVFSTARVKEVWYLIFAFAVLGITREGFKLYEKRYSKKLAVVTVVTNILTALLSVVFLLDNKIMNPKFVPAVSAVFEGQEPFITAMLGKINLLLLVIILFALTLDTTLTVIKGMKQRP